MRAFIAPVEGESPLFETGRVYIIKNYTLSHKFGRECIFLNPNSKKFQTASFELPEEAERSAKYLLNPPTALMSGEEQDLFSRGGFISLKGETEKVSKYNNILFNKFNFLKEPPTNCIYIATNVLLIFINIKIFSDIILLHFFHKWRVINVLILTGWIKVTFC